MSFPRRKTTFRIQRDCPAILFTNSYPYFFATPHAVNDCKDEAATKTTTATGLGHCEAGDEDVRFAFLVFERGILNISYWLGGLSAEPDQGRLMLNESALCRLR